MSKVDSLVKIKDCWGDRDISLFNKVTNISQEYYSANLKLEATAAYIGATPTELDAILALSELDEDLLRQVSAVNPPKTALRRQYGSSEEAGIGGLPRTRNRSSSGSIRQ